jgi:hypothetical protein
MGLALHGRMLWMRARDALRLIVLPAVVLVVVVATVVAAVVWGRR